MRPRYIPKDAATVEHAHGTVYTYMQNGRIFAIAYSGKRSKSDWHLHFRTEEQRSERIQLFLPRSTLTRSALRNIGRSAPGPTPSQWET